MTTNKADVYLPACYIVVKRGYEVPNALCLFPPQNGEHSPDSSLLDSEDDTRALEQPPKTEHQSTLERGLCDLQDTLAVISSQLVSLTETQSDSQKQLSRLEELCIENATQIKFLIENQATFQQQLQDSCKEQSKKLDMLKESQSGLGKQLQKSIVSNVETLTGLASKIDDWHVVQAQTQAEQEKMLRAGRAIACTHNVHPPPRKIDRPVVGYDYGTEDGGTGRWRVDRAPGLLRC